MVNWRSDNQWLKAICKEFDKLYIDDSDGLVYRRSPRSNFKQVLIPKTWIPLILRQFHGSQIAGHAAFMTAYENANKLCFWPGMKNDFENHCKTCSQCQKFMNPNPPYRAPLKPITATYPLEIVSTDIAVLPYSRNGNRYVVTVSDIPWILCCIFLS